jgi:hypothetical protein
VDKFLDDNDPLMAASRLLYSEAGQVCRNSTPQPGLKSRRGIDTGCHFAEVHTR